MAYPIELNLTLTPILKQIGILDFHNSERRLREICIRENSYATRKG